MLLLPLLYLRHHILIIQTFVTVAFLVCRCHHPHNSFTGGVSAFSVSSKLQRNHLNCPWISNSSSKSSHSSVTISSRLRQQQRKNTFGTSLFTTMGGSSSESKNNSNNDNQQRQRRKLPQLVVFDLDGCLWVPEMYELIYFMGNSGSPFSPSKDDPEILVSCKGDPVYLLGDVRMVMKELYRSPQWNDVRVGISSRTNEPNWAKELLEKFIIEDDSTSSENDDGSPSPTTNYHIIVKYKYYQFLCFE